MVCLSYQLLLLMTTNMSAAGLHQGFLRKYGGFMFKQWKERYLVLTMEGSLLVCRNAESPPDQVVALQTNCESIAEGREILDLPKLPPGGRRDCCFALILPQNKFLLLLTDNPDDCNLWLNLIRKVREGVMSPLSIRRKCSITPCITDRDPLPDSSSDKDPGSPRVGEGTPPLSRVTERGGSFRGSFRGQNQGLGISNGERWRQLRRFTLTTLRDFGMGRKGMEEWIQEESEHLRAHIETFKAKPFDPRFLLSCTVSNVICCLVFGQRFSYDDQQFLHLLTIIAEALKFISGPVGQMYNIFPWLMEHLPGQHHTVFASIDELRDFIKMKIQEHKETLDPSSPRDYIDCFLIRMDQEKDIPTTEFIYDNLVSTVLNLFLAGTEGISSTIRYAISVLIKHPNIQEKMQQEIDTVLGQDRCPRMENRKSLPFTDSVIHEVQRFLDITPLSLPHYALKDISFKGYTIPKDTVIIPLLHSVLREEKQWATPWSFNPQHFLDQNGNFKKNPAFLPFAAGKRACVGESLARMELFIFVVSLLRNFSFSCSEGPDSIDLTPEYSGFANLPRRFHMIATPR